MSKYRIVTANSKEYPFIIEVNLPLLNLIPFWMEFTQYKTLKQAQLNIKKFVKADLKSDLFVKRILE